MNDLMKVIEESGLPKVYIARMLGISRVTLANKLSGATEFKPSEIKCLQELLRLSDQETHHIFLS